MTATLTVELTTPQTVDGVRAPFQSIWLLVRLYHAARATPWRPQVHVDDLRARMSNARTLRMAIARAFRDFSRWGVQVGWGDDASRDPRFLNLEGRSQGPFWLQPEQCGRIRCEVNGALASPPEMLAFLGLDADGGATARGNPGDRSGEAARPARRRLSASPDLTFWRHFLDGKQALREGRLLTPIAGNVAIGTRGAAGRAGGTAASHRGRDAAASPPTSMSALSALSAFRAARGVAATEFEHAFVALNEALLWRRLGDRAQTRRTLRALRQRRRHHAIPGNDYLDAMEQIIAAWCVYDERDLDGALACLQTLARSEPGMTLVRVHPHVRFEWHNLGGLIARSLALGAACGTPPRRSAARTPVHGDAASLAEQAVGHFEQALAAAFESNVADAAQHVAANLGMALWLFGEAGIAWSGASPGGEVARAIQWIGLSEWLGRQTDHRHPSAWNAIYLMRIARGQCPATPRPSLDAFRSATPISVQALRGLAGPFADAFSGDAWPDCWHQVAAWRLGESERGERKYPLLQQSSLWFELAWYAAHAGRIEQAARALQRLRAELRQLPASDRRFFGKALLDSLPVEVHRLAEAG